MRAGAIVCCMAAVIGGGPGWRALAHEGPEHEIEELTERINQHGESPGLLVERAIELRVLGKLADAARDLERAGKLDPSSLEVQRELGLVLFLNGKRDEALATVTKALRLQPVELSELAALRMLRAEILQAAGDDRGALDECHAAIKLHGQNPEWYLLRSSVQKRLRQHEQRIDGLSAGIKETGAGVLEIERVEALLDAGLFAAALPRIERELDDSRIKSSWLIRRARALRGLNRRAEADASLDEAIGEIAGRLNPKMPDPELLVDKARAHELLGQHSAAIAALKEARSRGAPESLETRIKALEAAAAAD
jgi:tetratricopeptide (TPR) repeat protein